MIKMIKFVGIPVKDQERALGFWRDKIGCKVTTDQPFGTQRWIELRLPGAETGLVLWNPEGQDDRIGFWNGAFTCDDVVKTYEELKARGVEFTQAPKTESWGTSTIFKDSEGNSFALSSR